MQRFTVERQKEVKQSESIAKTIVMYSLNSIWTREKNSYHQRM